MQISPLRALQWVGIAVFVVATVGLTYDFESEAGKTVNAPVENRLSQGLLGYWKMDEGTGTSTTADASGNANTLTMTNADAEDWQTGQIGGFSLDFNGTDEWLTVADPSSGVLDIVDGADFTVVGWFNRDTENTLDTVVAKRNSDGASDAGYLVWLGTDDFLNFEISDGTDQFIRTSTSTFATTGWHHFAAVWNDGVGMSLYLDGVNQGSDTGALANIGSLANTVPFRIGAESSTGTENPFDGKIDDVKLYGKALSEDAVKRLYQTTVPGSPVDTGLVGHWTFDGPDVIWGDTSNEVKDVSGKGNHGDASGLTTSSAVIGKLGQGLSFNNATGDFEYVSIPDDSSLRITGDITLSVWVKYASLSNGVENIIAKSEWAGTNNYQLWSNSGFLRFDSTIGSQCYLSNQVPDTSWHHIVFVRSGTSGTFFIDSQGFDGDCSLSGSFGTSADSLYIAAIGTYDTFTGSIDDVRIYNRALSTPEITSLYLIGR